MTQCCGECAQFVEVPGEPCRLGTCVAPLPSWAALDLGFDDGATVAKSDGTTCPCYKPKEDERE